MYAQILENDMAIRWDKFTIKAQEAIQQASERGQNDPEICLCICWGAVTGQRRHCCAVWTKLGVRRYLR